MSYLRAEMEKILADEAAKKERQSRQLDAISPLAPHVETVEEAPKLDLPDNVIIPPRDFTP